MARFSQLLQTLTEHGIDFLVVGGVAGVLQGAPINTQDLDIVYSLEPPNPERLLAALGSIDATFRDDPRNLAPTLSHIRSRGHKLLSTKLGDIDCLGTIETDTTYEDLLPHVDWMEIAGMRIRVLSLPRLIEVKEKLDRPKDRLALLQLRATLEERGGE